MGDGDTPEPEFRALTDAEVLIVGKIILAWGSAESSLGWAVAWAYGLRDTKIARELILKRPLGQKLELAKKAFAQAGSDEIRDLLANLTWAYRHFIPARDALAHGFEHFDFLGQTPNPEMTRGVLLPSHDRLIRAADLGRQLQASEYASVAAATIVAKFMMPKAPEEAFPLLPPRPALLEA